MSESTVLRCNNIIKTFDSESGSARVQVLQGVDLDITRGDLVSIIGSSGSGKSTLLHILGGLDKPDSGELYWNNQSIYEYSDDKLAELRNQNVGFVFQFHHLMPEFTALENVMMPAMIKGDSHKEASIRAKELLDEFGMGHRLQHRPSQLSGGEQQRVSMARALTNRPSIILADEPTGNLDEENTKIILDLLFKLRELENLSVVLITHEKEIAARCDKTYLLQKGMLQLSD